MAVVKDMDDRPKGLHMSLFLRATGLEGMTSDSPDYHLFQSVWVRLCCNNKQSQNFNGLTQQKFISLSVPCPTQVSRGGSALVLQKQKLMEVSSQHVLLKQQRHRKENSGRLMPVIIAPA